MTPEEAVRARQIEESLIELRGPRELFDLLAPYLARLETLDAVMGGIYRVDPLLVNAKYHERKTRERLAISIPGLVTKYTFVLSRGKEPWHCGACGKGIPEGRHSYRSDPTIQPRLRYSRICLECAERNSPLIEDDTGSASSEVPDGKGTSSQEEALPTHEAEEGEF